MFFRKFGTVLLAVSAATIITLLVPPLGGGGMYFLFLTAIVFSSLYGDFRAGIAATALSILICVLFVYYDHPQSFSDWLVLPAFALAAGFTVFLCYAQVGAETARRQAENRYRAIFEDAITGIYETTLDGRYATTNPKLAQMFGYESANEMMREAENLNRRFYVEPGRREEFVRLVKEKENLVAFESEIYRRDGAKIWISENALAVRDETGELTGFQGTTIEITDRKLAESELKKAHEELEQKVVARTADLERANQILREEIEERERIEKALRESEEKFRALVEMSGELIWEVDENTIYTYISPVSKESNGYEPDELIGKKPFFLMPPEEAQRVAKIFKQIGEKQEKFVYLETINIHKDGSMLVSETSGVPFFDDAGNFRGYRGVARNITERRRADAALRASEKRYRELVENAKDFIYTADLDGNFTSLNRAGKEFVGVTDEQVLTTNFADFFPSEHLSLMRQKLAEKLAGKERTVYEIEVLLENRRCPVEVSSWLIYDEDGNPVGTQGIARDLTERKRAEETIRQSQKMLQLVMDTIPQGVFWKDKDGVFLGCNQYVAQRAGLERGEQIIGLSDYDLPWTKEESDFYRECDRRVMETGVAELGIVETLRQSDGKNIWLETNKVPLKNSVGETVGVLGTFKDITDQKRAEAALRESELHLGSVVTAAPVILFAVDSDGIFTLSEGKGLESFGLKAGEVVGKSVFEFYADVPKIIADIKRALAGESFINNIEIGDLIYESRYTPVFDEQKAVSGIIGVSFDITERKQIENALLKSEEKFRSIIEVVSDCVWEADEKGVYKFVSPQVKDVIGYEPEELLGKTPYDLIKPPEAGRVIDYLKPITAARRNFVFMESVVRHKNGESIITETSGVPVFNEAGKYCGYRGVVRDITARKRSENELRASQKQLRDLSAHLQSVREEERRNLARELHDEFGQSMTALKIELVRLGGKKAAARGDNQIPAMIDIVDTAMETVRKIVLELRPGVLDELGLAAAMEWQTKEFQKRTGIACSLHIEFEEPAACIKLKTTVFRILQECLTNIARHAQAKNVRITLRDEGTRIFFEIEDDGRGIDLARVEASDSHTFGILGMRERALLLDGTVEISRVETGGEGGSGTRVTVSIPRPPELVKFV